MDDTTLDSIIEVRHPDVDINPILTRIQERIQQRHERLRDSDTPFNPAFYKRAWLDLDDDRKLGTLYQMIGHTNEAINALTVNPTIVGRSPWLLRPVVDRLRRAAHNLVIFYINMLVGQQLVIDRSFMAVAVSLAAELEESLKRIKQVEEEMAQLRATLAHDEATRPQE